jgi:hypothetical protein
MKRAFCAAIAAAAVVAVGFPASASAEPPITPPSGSTCTFHKGLTTCVESLLGFHRVSIQTGIPDPSCPPPLLLTRVERTSGFFTTTTVFRGMHQVGEPQPGEEITSHTVETTCEDPLEGGPGRAP